MQILNTLFLPPSEICSVSSFYTGDSDVYQNLEVSTVENSCGPPSSALAKLWSCKNFSPQYSCSSLCFLYSGSWVSQFFPKQSRLLQIMSKCCFRDITLACFLTLISKRNTVNSPSCIVGQVTLPSTHPATVFWFRVHITKSQPQTDSSKLSKLWFPTKAVRLLLG